MMMMKHINILTTSPVPQHPLYSIAHLKSMKQLHSVASYPTPSTIVIDVLMILILIVIIIMKLVVMMMMMMIIIIDI